MLRKMSRLGTGVAAALACGFVMGAWSAPVQAEPLYRWESADGTVSFTDDAKRVPERYRETAKQIDTSVNRADEEAERALAETEAVEAPRGIERAARPRYIERRRAFLQPDGTVRYRYSRNRVDASNAPSLPVDPNDPNPVVTEHERVRVPGQPITQTITVTRQGDRVLSVEKPRSHYHSLDFGELSDYEN